MTPNKPPLAASAGLWPYWRGLGGWNLYFLLKFALLWQGYLNFHPLLNLAFMAYLLLPIRSSTLHRVRHWIAIPIGFALFWHDTWLPGLSSITSQGSQLTGFSFSYLLELFNRFINWQMVMVGFVIAVGYLFISQWIRVTAFVVLAMLWMNLIQISGPAISLLPNDQPAVSQTWNQTQSTVVNDAGSGTSATSTSGTNSAMVATSNLPPTTKNLNAYLQNFYQQQKGLMSTFPTSLPAEAVPFDILVINICSLSWSDIDAVSLRDHPFWQHFDIVFDNFNSATSYSGPASIRLLRASCGQPSHPALYEQAQQQCYLFDNLAALGFKSELTMDHSGVFGGYITDLRSNAGLQAELMSQSGINYELTAFDGEPIYNDLEILQRWLNGRKTSSDSRSATFFNSIALHDGNHLIGSNDSAPYQARAKTMFDQLDSFLNELEKSGRKVMVIVAPEHGAGLVGDKMQMSGLRDIASQSITHVPVGIKFTGMKSPHQGPALVIKQPSSYLAISELISRVVDGKIFTADSVSWSTLINNLPQTAPVSENSNSIVMEYQGKYYIQLDGGDWVAYPN